MSYFPNIDEELPTGIKGTALISASTLYIPWTHGASGTYQHNKMCPFRANKWSTNDITGNFDAVNNNGTSLLAHNPSDTYSTFRINPGKKVLLIAYYATSSLSTTSYATCYLTLTSSSQIGTTTRQYETISNACSNYFKPSHKIGGYNVYSDPLNQNLNSSEIGKYFKIAGINKLNNNLLYTYVETLPSATSTFLAWARTYCTTNASQNYITTTPGNHFIYMIQFY